MRPAWWACPVMLEQLPSEGARMNIFIEIVQWIIKHFKEICEVIGTAGRRFKTSFIGKCFFVWIMCCPCCSGCTSNKYSAKQLLFQVYHSKSKWNCLQSFFYDIYTYTIDPRLKWQAVGIDLKQDTAISITHSGNVCPSVRPLKDFYTMFANESIKILKKTIYIQ